MNDRFDSSQLTEKNYAALLLSCADQVGVIADVTGFFAKRGISLSDCSEFVNGNEMFLRVQWILDAQWLDAASFSRDFEPIAEKLTADFDVKFCDRSHSLGLFVASETEMLLGILNRAASSAIRGLDIAFIIACDQSVSKLADRYGLPFFYIDKSDGFLNQEGRLLDIIQRYKCDFLGLAQFPHELPNELLAKSACPVIQTAPMPLFADSGASSYQSEFERGAKLLGVSSFLLDLSEDAESNADKAGTANIGPIVHQDTSPVKNGSSVADLCSLGIALEQQVFLSTLEALLEHRVLRHGCKAIVFD